MEKSQHLYFLHRVRKINYFKLLYIQFFTSASTHFVLLCFVVYPTFFECYLKYMKWLASLRPVTGLFWVYILLHLNRPLINYFWSTGNFYKTKKFVVQCLLCWESHWKVNLICQNTIGNRWVNIVYIVLVLLILEVKPWCDDKCLSPEVIGHEIECMN